MTQIFTHPEQPQMQAEVILASKADHVPNIYTIRLRYPRIIHAELMTHRVFSRNAGSSRARPAKVTIQEVRDTPFVPWHWGKNQPGMQASEDLVAYIKMPSSSVAYTPSEVWINASLAAVEYAESLVAAGYHKQIFNRLLEPFQWIDVLVTATDWDNFLWLRDHEDAEPHIQDLARLVKQAITSAEPTKLTPGQWHLPYVTDADFAEFKHRPYVFTQVACAVSAARCARISYAPFGAKKPDIDKDLELYEKLVGNDRIHASPLEHQATPDKSTTFKGEGKYSDMACWDYYEWEEWKNQHLHGNLTGWIQYRKTVSGENYTKETL